MRRSPDARAPAAEAMVTAGEAEPIAFGTRGPSGLRPGDAGADFTRLWRAFRDLSAITALRSFWSGRDARWLAGDVAAAAVSIVDADAAHASIPRSGGVPAGGLRLAEAARLGREDVELLERAGDDGAVAALGGRGFGAETIHLPTARGPGRLTVVSRRPGFPSSVERFLLRHLANEAIVALDQGALLDAERVARANAEASASRMAELQRATAELAAPLSEAAAAEAFLHSVARALDLDGGVVRAMGDERAVLAAVDRNVGGERPIGREPIHLDLATASGPVATAALTIPDPLVAADRDFLLTLANEAAHAIERARDRTALEASAAAGQAFVGVVSHELRTPITTILGASELALRMPADDGRREELLRDLAVEAERLYRTVENLLILSRVEHATLELVLEPVMLGRAVERAVELERAHWPNASIAVESSGVVPPVTGEGAAIDQVLRNLIGNAAKYGGPRPNISVVVGPGERSARVVVLDRGPGLDPEAVRDLFELYYRTPELSSQATGAGIGLYVCRALVEAMGGRIWARPREGGGAEFGFELQAVEDERGV